MPSLAGLTTKQAKSQLEDLGLNLVIAREEFSEDIPEGKVISSHRLVEAELIPMELLK